MTNSPTAVSWGPGHVAVFYRGNDGKIWHSQRINGGTWSSGTFNAYGKGDYSVVSRGTGLMDVLYKGNDNHTWHSRYNGSSWSGSSLGSPFGGSLSEPAVVATTSGELVVFVRGLILDGQNGNPDVGGVYKKSSTDGGITWTGWQSMGVAEHSNPEAVATANGGWAMARSIGATTINLCTP